MAVGMTRVEMIDRHPVELRSEVLLHLRHHVAGEGAQVGEPVAVLGGDDEAELMPILASALQKLAARNLVTILGPIEPAPLSFPVGPVALQVAQMGVGALASDFQPDDPRLHHDAALPLARSAPLGGKLQPIGRRLASADATALPFPGPAPRAAARPSIVAPVSLARIDAGVTPAPFAFVTAFITCATKERGRRAALLPLSRIFPARSGGRKTRPCSCARS